MKTAELMKHVEIEKDTLRYYEKIGLISKPARLTNGYRVYTEKTIQEIKFIRMAQSVGFTLKQIKPAIPFVTNPKPNCPILGQALKDQIALVDSKIEDLLQSRARLQRWLDNNQALKQA
ncbi:MerR family transcriptional regulator [Marinicella sp. W31]|uniref:MerR family transcriptional regulator n=1 Tax=Marinicella sp. W31 TaxID=3023713 RepID=UPI0037577AF0